MKLLRINVLRFIHLQQQRSGRADHVGARLCRIEGGSGPAQGQRLVFLPDTPGAMQGIVEQLAQPREARHALGLPGRRRFDDRPAALRLARQQVSLDDGADLVLAHLPRHHHRPPPPALAMVALARQYVSHDGARHRQLIRPERPAKHVPGELTNVGQQPAQGRAALSR